MLQNFEDFQRASASKTELWLFLGKDLLVSLMSLFTASLWKQLSKSLWRQTAIVLVVLAILLAAASRHSGGHAHVIWPFCYGYILGWFSGWWRRGRQALPSRVIPNFLRTFWRQTIVTAVALAMIVLVAQNYPGVAEHSIWTLCYGFLLGWAAGWLRKPWQFRR